MNPDPINQARNFMCNIHAIIIHTQNKITENRYAIIIIISFPHDTSINSINK